MAYDERCFSAALVSLGVKGWLRIDEKDGDFTLTRRSGRQTPLSGPERRLTAPCSAATSRWKSTRRTTAGFRAAIDALRTGLALEYEGAMFRANRRWLWPGLALSIGALLAMGWYGLAPAASAWRSSWCGWASGPSPA